MAESPLDRIRMCLAEAGFGHLEVQADPVRPTDAFLFGQALPVSAAWRASNVAYDPRTDVAENFCCLACAEHWWIRPTGLTPDDYCLADRCFVEDCGALR